jgi:hypothetical protein
MIHAISWINLKSICSMKDARHKAVRFYVYDVQEPEKLFSGYQNQNSGYLVGV